MGQHLIYPIDDLTLITSRLSWKYFEEERKKIYGTQFTSKSSNYLLKGMGVGKVIAAGRDGSARTTRRGYCIVIRYDDVLLPNDITVQVDRNGNKKTYPSGSIVSVAVRLCHLDKIFVTVGDIITRATVIGYYGDSGYNMLGNRLLHIEASFDVERPDYTWGLSSSGNILKIDVENGFDNMIDPIALFTCHPKQKFYVATNRVKDGYVTEGYASLLKLATCVFGDNNGVEVIGRGSGYPVWYYKEYNKDEDKYEYWLYDEYFAFVPSGGRIFASDASEGVKAKLLPFIPAEHPGITWKGYTDESNEAEDYYYGDPVWYYRDEEGAYVLFDKLYRFVPNEWIMFRNAVYASAEEKNRLQPFDASKHSVSWSKYEGNKKPGDDEEETPVIPDPEPSVDPEPSEPDPVEPDPDDPPVVVDPDPEVPVPIDPVDPTPDEPTKPDPVNPDPTDDKPSGLFALLSAFFNAIINFFKKLFQH